jgi:hypothetical protein
LSRCSIETGARSVAEFVRLAVLQNMSASNAIRGTLSGDLATVSQALSELDTSLGDVRRRIRGVLGRVSSEADDK